MIENAVLVLLLLSPIAMIAYAIRMKRARAAGLVMKPWDKSFRNGMLLSLGGVLLGGSGLYAYAKAAGTRSAPLFGLPVVLGVVLLVAGYRTWMRGVSQVPDES
jgi:hypothetical protein